MTKIINLIKDLFKNPDRNFVIITQVINAVIGLISGKIIAIYLLPEEFGIYNIQFATLAFVTTLLISPFLQYLKSTNKTLLPRIGSKIYFLALLPLVLVAIIITLLSIYFYLGYFNYTLSFILLVFIPLTLASSAVSDFLNINNKIKYFLKMSILKSIASLCFILIFFTLSFTFLTGTEALWLMQLVGVFFGFIFFAKYYKLYDKRFEISYQTFFKRYFKFAWPLIVLAFWSWINNFFDRYAIDYYMTTDNVGVYNANYGLGSKFFLMISPIFMVLLTPLIYDVIKIDIKKTIILKYAKLYIIIGLIVLSFIYVLKEFIGSLLLSDAYSDGFYLIFWIAFAFFILTLTHLFETIFYAEGKTKVILYGNIFSAVFNIGLNIILIPVYGLTGAFLATVCGFLVHLVYVNFKFNKL